MPTEPFTAFFTADGDTLVPTPAATSGWNAGLIRGPAITGILARAAEDLCPAEMIPARFAVEMFRPAPMRPSTTGAQPFRQGRRQCVVDTVLTQGGQDVARAHITFLAPSDAPRGLTWTPGVPLPPPPGNLTLDAEGRLYSSSAGWSSNPDHHNDESRKHVWQFHRPLVGDEKPTPFQSAAIASDLTSLVVHWGTQGVDFINPDVSLSLARLPQGPGIGLSALHLCVGDGISAGSAVLWDEVGTFGTASLSGLLNTAQRVDVGTGGKTPRR